MSFRKGNTLRSFAAMCALLWACGTALPVEAQQCQRLTERYEKCSQRLVAGKPLTLRCQKIRKRLNTNCGGLACSQEYSPVCGQPPMPKCGPRELCAAVMPPITTYPNLCAMVVAGASLVTYGSCGAK